MVLPSEVNRLPASFLEFAHIGVDQCVAVVVWRSFQGFLKELLGLRNTVFYRCCQGLLNELLVDLGVALCVSRVYCYDEGDERGRDNLV